MAGVGCHLNFPYFSPSHVNTNNNARYPNIYSYTHQTCFEHSFINHLFFIPLHVPFLPSSFRKPQKPVAKIISFIPVPIYTVVSIDIKTPVCPCLNHFSQSGPSYFLIPLFNRLSVIISFVLIWDLRPISSVFNTKTL